MFKGQRRAVAMAQEYIAQGLSSGAMVVDATAGNGRDTLFLASALGINGVGLVYSFDIQQQALESTSGLLEQHGLRDKVKLINDGHQHMEEYIDHPVDAVMFNLGYLPGGDHSVITKTENTVKALNTAINLLRVGGRISLVVYTGHQGGTEELEGVKGVLTQLNSVNYWVVGINFVNRPPTAPVIFFVERMG